MPKIDPDRRALLSSLALTPFSSLRSAELERADAPTPVSTAAVHQAEEFGAVGDGRADDSAAFSRALASIAAGGTLQLAGGRSYRLTRSLVLQRPLLIKGGTKENTRLVFDEGAYSSLGGQRAAMIFPHETSGTASTARRSSVSGVTIEWAGNRDAGLHGLLIAAPVYLYEVDVIAFPHDGFRVEATTPEIKGNANGCSFMNCSARGNGGNGFLFLGDDANACILVGARSFDNAGAGFLDASLIGNTYLAAEVDGNYRGGFVSDKKLPNRSVYLGCYAEPSQRYDLNARNLLIAPLGYCSGQTSAMLRALPSGDLFSRTAMVFARDESDAVDSEGKTGKLLITAQGVDLIHADGQRVRLTKLLSADYVDVLNDDVPVIRLPRHAIGNVGPSRPWMPQGVTLGAQGNCGIMGSGKAPPKAGPFQTGALWLNETPRPGAVVGWVCIASGDPGTWHGFGTIDVESTNT